MGIDNFQSCIDIILLWEAGYVNNPSDPGKATNWGISQTSYPNLNIASLTRQQACDIYNRDYWTPLSLNNMPQSIALLMLDSAINQGKSFAARMLQIVLDHDLVVDGSIGTQTINAVNSSNETKLLHDLAVFRMMSYVETNNWSMFGKGWSNRLFDIYGKAYKQIK